MNDFESWVTIREQLREHPSVEVWEIELDHILLGRRSHLLEEDDSASDYVEGILSASRSPEYNRSQFREALFRIIETWQPLSGPTKAIHAIDLIESYTPAVGLPKILGFLAVEGDFNRDPENQYGLSFKLTFKALKALQAYFPVPPNDPQSPTFLLYLSILRDSLKDARYRGHALTRLIALRVFEPSDTDVMSVIGADPKVLVNLTAYWLSVKNNIAAEYALSQIYGHCLLLDHEIGSREFQGSFDDALAKNSARLLLGRDLDPVIIHLGRSVRLMVDGLGPAAKASFKERYLDALLVKPDTAGIAIAKLLRMELVDEGSLDVRSAIEVKPEEVIEHLISFALSSEDSEKMAKRLTNIFDHCLALDDADGEPRIVTSFKASLEKRGVFLDYNSQHEDSFGVEILVEDRRIPLMYDTRSTAIAFAALEAAAAEMAMELK